MKWIKGGEVDIERKVLTARPAGTLADYATKDEGDLIVISTHGQSGVRRWVWGSVAERVLRPASRSQRSGPLVVFPGVIKMISSFLKTWRSRSRY